jgi:hypothetical protein
VKPALMVHGGPGSGCVPSHRRSFDPARYRVVLFEELGHRPGGEAKPGPAAGRSVSRCAT